jgi:hypothetical protein
VTCKLVVPLYNGLPRVSAATTTPPLNLMPSTDVPVTMG